MGGSSGYIIRNGSNWPPRSHIRELAGEPRNRREARAAAAIAKKAARTKTKV